MTRFLPGRQLFGLLLLCLSVYKTTGMKQIDMEASEAVEQQNNRKLQTNFTIYNFNTTATYAFEFDIVTAPQSPPTQSQVQELLRRTGIYLTRSTSSVYASAFQGLQLVYHSLEWQADDSDDTDLLVVNFQTRVSFRNHDAYGRTISVPDSDQVMNAVVDIDHDFFLTNFVKSVDPQEIFTKATSVVIIAESMDYTPTIAPTESDASMIDDTEGQIPETATQSTNSIGGSLADPFNTGNYDSSLQEDASAENVIDAGVQPCLIADFSTNADGEVIVSKNKTPTQYIAVMLSQQLAAANMFYYFVVACVLYWAARFGLNKWSRAYQDSSKQLQLETYWVQLAIFTPLIVILIWATTLIRADEWNCVTKGLKVFSHVAMIVLAITGMDIFVRGYDMTKLLMAQKVTVIVTMLYVISGSHHGLHEPLDLFEFGIIEAFGALAVHPSLVAMIYYRWWSDSSVEEKELNRSKVGTVMRAGVALGLLLKIVLVITSAWWYIAHVSRFGGSSLIWFLPLIRSVDTLVTACSLQVQYSLYKKVVWGNLTTSKPESTTDEGSDRDRHSERGEGSEHDEIIVHDMDPEVCDSQNEV